jgi:hypothetical protein
MINFLKLITIASILFLTGCDSAMHPIHRKAKNNPDHKICYSIYEPEDLQGRYCMFYEKGIE